ncbi:hypothetical protein GMSM_26400 [Geomonas sp. Red276]
MIKAVRSMAVLIFLLFPALAQAKTLVVAGRLSSEVTVTQMITFGVDQKISELTYRFPLPARVGVPSLSQRMIDHRISFDPEPDSVADETDQYGNSYKVVVWKKLSGDARATIVFTTDIDAVLDPLSTRSGFPMRGIPEEAAFYLKPSKLVQSADPEIVAKAAELTAGATTESAAVEAILNFVADQIRYETPPKSYDALFGLRTGTGNCQNFAHLSCALLRASGIPARVAVGLTLKDKWKIPLDDRGSSLVQGMGEGLHAWVEIYYPGLGWLPYDPQQSKQFTSTRHIKYAHGPEAAGIGTSWRSSPVLPRYSALISSSFSKDVVDLTLKGSGSDPRGYITSNEMIAAAPEVIPVPPPVTVHEPVPVPRPEPVPEPKKVVKKPEPVPEPPRHVVKPRRPLGPPPIKPDRNGMVVFGNTRFPTNLSFYTNSGDHGEASLERETAEYVTSTGVYAQAFVLDRPLRIEKVSLAMKKFGGDGTVYLDIVADDGGKPGLVNGVRSKPVYLENVRKTPGYGWLDFTIPADSDPFPPGKYWMVLRRSGEAIMNWYYTPGKPYGGPDDTRSTVRGWQWEDILTYDFVFKVAGRVVRQ